MTSGVIDKLKSQTALLDALQLIIDEQAPDGALKLVSGTTKGAVCFAGGKLTGAYVHTTGERGNDALAKLLDLQPLKIKYTEFDQAQIAPNERLMLDIKDIIAQHQPDVATEAVPSLAAEMATEAVAPLDAAAAEPVVAVEPVASEPEPVLPQEEIAEEPEAVAAEAPALTDEPDNLTVDIPSHISEAFSQASEEGATIDIPIELPEGIDLDSNLTIDVPNLDNNLTMDIPSAANVDDNLTMDIPSAASRSVEDSAEQTLGFPTQAIAELSGPHDENLTMDIPPASNDPLDPQQADALIHDLSAHEDKAEFSQVDGVLEHSEEMLSDDQKKMLEELTRNLRDEEAFHETDEQLNVQDDVTERQQQLLETAALDEKPFDYVEAHLETDIPSLSEEQRKLLSALSSEASDKETFEELDEFLQLKGVHLTPEQLWEYGELIASRSKEEQQKEFAERDERLSLPDDSEFYDFAEHEGEEESDSDELDEILTPNVIDADRSKYRQLAEKDELKKRAPVEGIIGRARDQWSARIRYFQAERRRRKEFPIGKVLGGITLTLLLVGIFTIPGMIKAGATGKSHEELTREQMRLAVQGEMEDSTPKAEHEDQQEQLDPGGQQIEAGHGSRDAAEQTEAPGGAVQNDQMAYAHQLVSEGKIEMASQYMESYVAANPDNVSARISLIQCYIQAKHKDKARLLCIQTLKRKLSSGEQMTVWNLWRSCLP